MLWLGSFQLGEFAQARGNEQLALTIYGYTMGYVTVFAGHLFWDRVVQGRWAELLGDGWLSRSFSAICLLGIFIMGLVGVYSTIFGTNPWYYLLCFAAGGIVVNQGLKPIMEHLERGNHSPSRSQA
ncbi:hypothetical protein FHT15_002475 [Xanthomonas campestris]